MSEADSVC